MWKYKVTRDANSLVDLSHFNVVRIGDSVWRFKFHFNKEGAVVSFLSQPRNEPDNDNLSIAYGLWTLPGRQNITPSGGMIPMKGGLITIDNFFKEIGIKRLDCIITKLPPYYKMEEEVWVYKSSPEYSDIYIEYESPLEKLKQI